MISATQPAKRRRWFRFSLRSLMLLVTVAAVASWVYFVAWPWWQMHLQQARFLRAVANIRESLSIINSNSPVLPDAGPWIGGGWILDAAGNQHTLDMFEWPNECYFLVCQYPSPPDKKSIEKIHAVSVEVFRVPPASANYVARTDFGREVSNQPGTSTEEKRTRPYFIDFLAFIIGDRKQNPGVKYELIYSDPPSKDKSH